MENYSSNKSVWNRPVLTHAHNPMGHAAGRKIMKILVTRRYRLPRRFRGRCTGYPRPSRSWADWHDPSGSASALRKARHRSPSMGDFRRPGEPGPTPFHGGPRRRRRGEHTPASGGRAGTKPPSPGTVRRYAPCGRRLLITGGALVFTSGSAVFGVFNGGDATDTVYDEEARLPLPASVFAPAIRGRWHPLLARRFRGGDGPLASETERAVLADRGACAVLWYDPGWSTDAGRQIRTSCL